MTRSPVQLLIILAWILGLGAKAAYTFLPPEPDVAPPTFHYHMIEQGKAERAAAIAENIFSLPRGHLSPVYGYEEIQFGALTTHLRIHNSRYAVFTRETGGVSFVLSPWVIRRSEMEPWVRAVLFLKLAHTGEMSPLGYAVVKDGVPPGYGEDLWTTLKKAARTTSQEMMTAFGFRRLVTPVL